MLNSIGNNNELNKMAADTQQIQQQQFNLSQPAVEEIKTEIPESKIDISNIEMIVENQKTSTNEAIEAANNQEFLHESNIHFQDDLVFKAKSENIEAPNNNSDNSIDILNIEPENKDFTENQQEIKQDENYINDQPENNEILDKVEEKEDNNFEIEFTKENLELTGEGNLYPSFSKFSNEIFTRVYKANKKSDVNSEFLLDSDIGIPTGEKAKWESAYALQQLNFGLNSKHGRLIQRTINNLEFTYYYDSDGDGNFEHEISFDKDNNQIFNKLINKDEKYPGIISIENKNNTCLKICTKECDIIENLEDKHFIQAGTYKVEINYSESGKVESMECIELQQDKPETNSIVLSASKPEANGNESNENQDDLASLVNEINSTKDELPDILE